MKVVYKKKIWEKLNDAIAEAKDTGKTIDYIEITRGEYVELSWYFFAIGCRNTNNISYGGTPLKVVG